MIIDRLTPVANLPELLRPEEAAAFLGISKWLIYEMAKYGELPHIRLGKLLRIKREGLIELVGQRRSA